VLKDLFINAILLGFGLDSSLIMFWTNLFASSPFNVGVDLIGFAILIIKLTTYLKLSMEF